MMRLKFTCWIILHVIAMHGANIDPDTGEASFPNPNNEDGTFEAGLRVHPGQCPLWYTRHLEGDIGAINIIIELANETMGGTEQVMALIRAIHMADQEVLRGVDSRLVSAEACLARERQTLLDAEVKLAAARHDLGGMEGNLSDLLKAVDEAAKHVSEAEITARLALSVKKRAYTSSRVGLVIELQLFATFETYWCMLEELSKYKRGLESEYERLQ